MERNAADPGFMLRELRSFQMQASRKADLEKVFQEHLEATRDVLRRVLIGLAPKPARCSGS